MRLYTKKKQYNQETGKSENISVYSNLYLCDCTGTIINHSKTPEFLSICSLQLNQISGSEESWYYEDLSWLYTRKNQKILDGRDEGEIKEMIFSEPYHFSVKMDTCFSFFLAKEWLADVNNNGMGIFKDCHSFEHVLRVSRIRVLQQALKNKKISLCEIIGGI